MRKAIPVTGSDFKTFPANPRRSAWDGLYFATMNLPERVAVMALPNAILFPRAFLPVHVFEERYRLMLAECLRDTRLMAVALRKEGAATETPHTVAGIGVIRTSIRQPDGTSNLVVEGLARVQILEYTQLQPYRVARIQQLDSIPTVPSPVRAELVATVQKLTKARARFGAELPAAALKSLLTVEDMEHLTDLVGHTLLDDFRQKQLLLETLDVQARLDRLVAVLRQQLRQVELWRKLQGDLPNDHVGQN